MFNNPYMMNYNPSINQQGFSERIDNEIAKLQQMKEQMNNNHQQPAINQTIQLAPTNGHTMRYANTIEDVNRESVCFDTPFFSKDMSVLWVKSVNGNIKTYELSEIVPKDDKDLLITNLQMQIEQLRKEIDSNAKSSNTNDDESTESTKSTNVSVSKSSAKAKK